MSSAGTSAPPDTGGGQSVDPSQGGAGAPAATCMQSDVVDCDIQNLDGNPSAGCKHGQQHCEQGMLGACSPDPMIVNETCNGSDDDCDGRADEDANLTCFPDGMIGCGADANDAWSCVGSCNTGKRTCRDGTLEGCTGFVGPVDEICTKDGVAADEDCDGLTDEGCACTGTQSRSCYNSTPGTAGVGVCVPGNQACNNGMLGPCTGMVVPADESCANEKADDNCDGMVDNIPNRGAACTVTTNVGACRSGTLQCQGGSALTCVTTAPATETCNMIDDNCDGNVDEPFNLQTDSAHCGNCTTACSAGQSCCAGKCTTGSCMAPPPPPPPGCGTGPACASGSMCCGSSCANTQTDTNNCGTCGTVCAMGDSCCAGKCVNPKTDANNCGMCGSACTLGGKPGCCDSKCVDLLSDANCGTCGHTCGIVQGVTCSCGVVDGGGACMGTVLGICL
jgi:hypothetical protein